MVWPWYGLADVLWGAWVCLDVCHNDQGRANLALSITLFYGGEAEAGVCVKESE